MLKRNELGVVGTDFSILPLLDRFQFTKEATRAHSLPNKGSNSSQFKLESFCRG